jgi:cytoskeletal protein RodZ
MTEMLDTPPMSGGNLPLKEIKKEEGVREEKTGKNAKKRKPVYLVFIFLIILFFTGGIALGFYLKQQQTQAPPPSFSPLPSVEPTREISPSPSVSPQGLEARLNEFERQLKETDLKEEQLSPPALDFNIRFEIEE